MQLTDLTSQESITFETAQYEVLAFIKQDGVQLYYSLFNKISHDLEVATLLRYVESYNSERAPLNTKSNQSAQSNASSLL